MKGWMELMISQHGGNVVRRNVTCREFALFEEIKTDEIAGTATYGDCHRCRIS